MTPTPTRSGWAAQAAADPVRRQGPIADSDWWTHKPESFDVAHSDTLFLVDPSGHLRIVVVGMPNVHGKLAAQVRSLLSDSGLKNLARPEAPWTVSQALGDLSHVLGRRILTSVDHSQHDVSFE